MLPKQPFVPSSSEEVENVRVVIRVRPMSPKEKEAGYQQITTVNSLSGQIFVRNPQGNSSDTPKMFAFDIVFDIDSKQLDVYNVTARPIVEKVLAGYNGTIFAYGQTGTGKTYTMEGIRSEPEQKGIIPNSFAHIFGHIAKANEDKKFLVRVSYFEIYNEEIRDLLSKNSTARLEVKERPDVGVFVKDLSTYVVNNADDMDRIMTLGNKNRVVGATAMNSESSRSHAIFSITVETSQVGADGEEHVKMGRLHLVDLAQVGEYKRNLDYQSLPPRTTNRDIKLPYSFFYLKRMLGSERQSKTGAVGQRLREATKINLSLSTLGNVISALVDGKCTHIPYRNSKLTRILQDSLGGNSKTVMCATIGPVDYNYDETISTLRYASRAKNICNRARINEDPKDALLRQFQLEIETLRRQLEEGGTIDHTQSEGEGEGESSEEEGKTNNKNNKIHRVKSMTMDQLGEADQNVVTNQKLKDDVVDGGGEDDTNVQEQELAIAMQREIQEPSKMDIILDEHKLLQDKLDSLEKKILVGGENLLEKAEEQEKLLEMSAKELEQRRTEEEQLKQKLQQKEAERIDFEEKYSNLQEEAVGLTRKLKKLQSLLKSAQEEQKDVAQENQREMEGLLDNVRQLHKELGLQEALQKMYIPDKYKELIQRHAHWNEDIGEWQLKCVAYTGNNMRKSISPSSPLLNPEIVQPNLSHVYLTYTSGRPQTCGRSRAKSSISNVSGSTPLRH